MKQDIGLDFGTVIAYLVPGVIAARGLSFVYPELRRLFHFGPDGKSDLALFALLALVGIAIGLIVSAARAATLDMSFAISLSAIREAFVACCPPNLKAAAREALDYFDAQKRVDPQFGKLTSDGRLAAYVEARATDKRPYQFYGNLFIALAIYIAGAVFEHGPLGTDFPVIVVIAHAIGFGLLYSASRRSHYRYMKSVTDFNSLP